VKHVRSFIRESGIPRHLFNFVLKLSQDTGSFLLFLPLLFGESIRGSVLATKECKL